MAEAARISFVEPTGPGADRVDEYQVRVWSGDTQTAEAFEGGVPADAVAHSSPGAVKTVILKDLKAETQYTAGVRPIGRCLDGRLAYTTFTTEVRKFTQLSGCFVATAAYGSPMAASVDALRRVRDRARPGNALAVAAIDAYERSSPPLADLLRTSELGRALARRLLGPVVAAAQVVAPPAEAPQDKLAPRAPSR
jgi:hypothetical protein